MSSTQPTKPQETLRDGALKITIWRNEGENGPYFTATPGKTYEKDDELRDGNSYLISDLLRLSELARQAHVRITALRAAHRHVPDSRHEFNGSRQEEPVPAN